MNKIIDLSIAYWRLEKWVFAAPIDRKLAAESSLRIFKEYFKSNKIEIIDLTGQNYDPGLSVEVMYYEDDDSKEDKMPIITEMMRPIIVQDGNVIEFGQVVIAKNPIKIEENNQSKNERTVCVDGFEEKTKELVGIPQKAKVKKIYKRIVTLACSIVIIVTFVVNGFFNHQTRNLILEMKNQNSVISRQLENINNDITENENSSKVNTLQSNVSKDGVTWSFYVVRQGDTLISICDDHGINFHSWEQIIKQQNGISNTNNICTGQIILLPIINEER